ncbi:uncharacterized protein TEOVI_000481700 [Trypanosoma equiperdum]|uniref:Uncharacterized protein n=3 Tax=Trypanozoon TaxID=39700 RepID=Q38D01_TRYB2|nr:hypothetical protein, conserved [Trypanosoma brucei gambiense DAL972]XP_827649.1 hypothetical protein, conserved [Trypanosoma brucei brucei TREU927]EAN77319.1 hypothetical protein, conserved [Trypanosoma brucei brucei TREU927]CBH14849.1 hypothetical protein, conserved [Trypanosoma brucei gambiense DAL972]SCU65625.1 hypothetical protein, conserved [Trypanosoma equiperdum]|eukprot:XP_011777115.1 hypothetical protein, conserved [Trypanosoma brucei gambiense DAL972]
MWASGSRLAPALSKATRLQLGNIKTEYGYVSTAAGSQEKWGFLFKGRRYPLISCGYSICLVCIAITVVGTYQQYRDMIIMTEHISYEDVKDRCLTPMPGWARLRSLQIASPLGPMTYRDPTPLDWLPFELKLGCVKQASY